jgi:hypothetical protein
MYSLGVILFEMCQLFKTDMERLKTLEALRQGILSENFSTLWPTQVRRFEGLYETYRFCIKVYEVTKCRGSLAEA